MQGFVAPFKGFACFLSRPRLWWTPLLLMLLTTLILIFVAAIVAYYAWPHSGLGWVYRSFKIFQALGLSAFAALFVWLVVFPILLNICFERLIKKIYLAEGETLVLLTTHQALISSFIMFKRTFLLRCIWMIFCLVAPFIYGPLGVIASQIAIAHLAFVDGMDLSLALFGIKAKKRYQIYHKYRFSVFMGGFIGGLFACLFLPTLLVWLFWIPSLYVGAALFAKDRKE